MAAHRPPHDSVDPASQGFGPFEGVKAGVDHDEHFLDDIVRRGRADAETPNRRPNEIKVLPVDGFERRHFGPWRMNAQLMPPWALPL